jgi:hypothetical protein
VFVTAEDDEAEVHRRLSVVDPFGRRHEFPGKLIIIALPSAGGPMPFFVSDHNGVMETAEWRMICDQLVGINLKLVCFDPLANFAQVPLDVDSTAAQFVTSQFGRLAAETKATVLLPHHMRKTAKAPQTVAEAREAIRGSSGIVDGVRLAYALWPVDDDDGKKVCKDLRVLFNYNRVVRGAVVKANSRASREIVTYVRSDDGLLIDRSDELCALRPAWDELQDALVETCAKAAEAGKPFTKTGRPGLYERRAALPECLRSMAKHKLESLCQELIEAQRLVQCKASGSNAPQWLDVPGGRFAIGGAEFVEGAQVVPSPGGERS